MATKTITITEDAYEALATGKNDGESFSELILRTHKKKGDIKKFIGAWADMDNKISDKIKAHIKKIRNRAGKQRKKELTGNVN